MELVSQTYYTDSYKYSEDDEATVLAMAACTSYMFPTALGAAVQLGLFDILGDGAHRSLSDIASRLPITADGSVTVLDSILRVLASHSLLVSSVSVLENGAVERRFGISPAGKLYAQDDDAASFGPYLRFLTEEMGNKTSSALKDVVLEGSKVYDRMYGNSFYKATMLDQELCKRFERVMREHSIITMKRVLKSYDGFSGLGSIVNVAGGTGSILGLIISKYPSIRGINFDLPQVVQIAPSYQGVEHIGGDMFLEVPKGDAIFLKFILHNWSDESCVKLLKNCHKALPDNGKVIVMDGIMPNKPQADIYSKYASQMDLIMSAFLEGNVRTEAEYETMAKKAGFGEFKVFCHVCGLWIMEFIKLV